MLAIQLVIVEESKEADTTTGQATQSLKWNSREGTMGFSMNVWHPILLVQVPLRTTYVI